MSAEQEYTAGPVETVPQGSDGESFSGSGDYETGEDGQRTGPGMGQSKSSRRRRRKRKNKGSEGATAAPGTGGSSGGEAGAIPTMSANGGEAGAPAGVAPMQPVGQQSFRQAGQNGQTGGGTMNGGGGPRGFGGPQQAGGGMNQGQGQGQGTKRWKKKFRDRDRPRGEFGGQGSSQGFQNGGGQNGGQPGVFQSNGGFQGGIQSSGAPVFRGPDTHQPGNTAPGFSKRGGKSSGGGFKQRSGGSGGGGGRGFVGPMDHSYRVVNGNIFETPPATINDYGNGNGGHGGGFSRSRGGGGGSAHSDSQPIDYSQGKVIPVADDAPTRIYFFIDDLFITAKIQETARKLGVKVAFIKNEKEQIATLTGAEEEDRPGLIVFDLNNANAKPMTLIPKLKAKLKKSTSIIGFLSQVQGDLKAKAVEVGCDTVMPRAAFSQNLPNLLRRYGLEEVEETNFNQ